MKVLDDDKAIENDSMQQGQHDVYFAIPDETMFTREWGTNEAAIMKNARGVHVSVNRPVSNNRIGVYVDNSGPASMTTVSQTTSGSTDSTLKHTVLTASPTSVTPAVVASNRLITAATSSVAVLKQTSELGYFEWPAIVKTITNGRRRRVEPEPDVKLKKEKHSVKRLKGDEELSVRTDERNLQYALGPALPRITLPMRDIWVSAHLEFIPHLRVHRMEPMSPALMILLSLAKYDSNGFLTLLYFMFGESFTNKYAELLQLCPVDLVGESTAVLRQAINIQAVIETVRGPLSQIVSVWPRHQRPR
jgi:hypothetical protein